MNISARITEELGVNLNQVDAAIKLLDEGSTVPFIARYRKEATLGLDDTQLRHLEERLIYLREMEQRRSTILKTIEEQGKLTDDLKQAIMAAETKTRLEDLYLPYKQKRRTGAQIAHEAGIEPLLDALLDDPAQDPQLLAEQYINIEADFADVEKVLKGARNIFLERVGEEADLVGQLREHVWENAHLKSTMLDGQEQSGVKFKDYFDYAEPLKDVPSHRALALFRGRTEGVLRLKLFVPQQDDLPIITDLGVCDAMVARHFQLRHQGRAADNWLMEGARWGWRTKVSIQLESELYAKLRERADAEAIRVFGENLRDLLLAAPAGTRATMGLDPGLRTGVKVVVLDQTGKLLEYATIYPHVPKNQWAASISTLAKLVHKHKVELISIGNGTASRETDKLVKDLIKQHPGQPVHSVVVSEAGASIYSASEFAAREFPDLDVTLRGAVSIARRLQDPLAELVKIEPKSIGVGQYQHDVNQYLLARKLDAVVEDCVNAVGVEINTASVPLLAKVAGLSESLASGVVSFREEHGAFTDRQQLLKVPRLGPKAFEQAAGFLRIQGGSNPLDASSVHPEAYPVVERIMKINSKAITEVIGDSKFLKSLSANDFTDEHFGEFTVQDIIKELEKPGRDPRPQFKTASFKDGVENLKDLLPGMLLEGTITNVTNFGAFVDIGVHQDGLVHISLIADKFVKDPREIVRTGEVVKVKVMEVDLPRKRIALSMRLNEEINPDKKPDNKTSPRKPKHKPKASKAAPAAPQNTAMAAAFAKLK